jgi:Domain of unknown function (DUF4296)
MACNRAGSEGANHEVISEEKFVDVLSQVRLLEAAYAVKFDKVDSTAGIASYYKNLFQQQGITKKQFESSYKYYASKQDIMIEIEEKVLEKLSILNTETRQKLESEPRSSVDSAGVTNPKDATGHPFEELKK